MNTVGNIAGPLLAYEVLTAFLLEATFLIGYTALAYWIFKGKASDLSYD